MPAEQPIDIIDYVTQTNVLHATVNPSNLHSERNSPSAAIGFRRKLQVSGSPWPTHHHAFLQTSSSLKFSKLWFARRHFLSLLPLLRGNSARSTAELPCAEGNGKMRCQGCVQYACLVTQQCAHAHIAELEKCTVVCGYW